jgi:CRP/FNR family cyclic AMP-dependent transcriptional regulator
MPGATQLQSPDGPRLFRALDEAPETFVRGLAERHYRPGQLLFREGETRDTLFLLRRGLVLVTQRAPDGARATLAVVRAPEVLGEPGMLGGPRRSLTVEALEETSAVLLPRATLLAHARCQPALHDAVLHSLGALVRRMADQAADYVLLDLAGRLAKVLVQIATADGELSTVDLTQARLAEMVGGTRQSVNRVLSVFVARGWLRREGRRLVVEDGRALRRRAKLG